MWNDADGFYYDYDFVHGRGRRYPFLTTFYPLWAGIASAASSQPTGPESACIRAAWRVANQSAANRRPVGRALRIGSLAMDRGEALRRYGYKSEADRVSQKFLSLVQQEFVRYGTIEEKYDVVRRQSDVSNRLRFGYSTNEAGFGWTNAVFTALFDELAPSDQQNLLNTR